jgi:hypothetical protein
MLKNKKSHIKNQNYGIPARRINFLHFTFCILIFAFSLEAAIADQVPLVRVADVNVGESQTVTLHDGSNATVKLLDLKETRDSVCFAVRRAVVTRW